MVDSCFEAVSHPVVFKYHIKAGISIYVCDSGGGYHRSARVNAIINDPHLHRMTSTGARVTTAY